VPTFKAVSQILYHPRYWSWNDVYEGYAEARSLTEWFKIKNPNPQDAEEQIEHIKSWARSASEFLLEEFPGDASFVIVSVPSKITIHNSTPVQYGPTKSMATCLVHRLVTNGTKARLGPEIHWTKKIQEARSGGPREAEVLAPSMTVVGDFQSNPEDKIILVDDVMLYGGHLKAAAQVLSRTHDLNVVMAFVVAHVITKRLDYVNPLNPPRRYRIKELTYKR
jgi:hypothetical protein